MKTVIAFLTFALLSYQLFAASFSESGNTPWGMDGDIAYKKKEKTESEKPKLSASQKTCKAMIRFFQIYISPIDGPRSSFYPTSSQYALEAIQKYGMLRGIGMGCDRLMRENGEQWVYKTIHKFDIERKYDPIH